MRSIPCAYATIFDASRASCTAATRSCGPGAASRGPLRTSLAATRSLFMLDSTRAFTAAAIDGTGTPRSSATRAVHIPVPFWPALSSTRSTSQPPSGSGVAKISAVISTRNDSSGPAFQPRKVSARAGASRPPRRASRSYASARNCMSAYSMPLCTIFTK